VHAALKSGFEVEMGRFSRLPNILAFLFHHLTIEHRDSSKTEVSWDLELVGGSVDIDWESYSVVESDVSVLLRSAEYSVGDLRHSLNVFLTVTLGWLLSEGLLELVEVLNNVLFEADGLDEDRGLGQWVSLDGDLLWLSSHLFGLTASTNLVVPFLEAAILFHGLSIVLGS
jgi:hypothetical protein